MFNRQKRWTVTNTTLAFVFFLGCSLAFGQQTLPDPTRPVVLSDVGVTEPKTVNWTLSSIVIAPQRRVAVINDKVVKVGQTIGGAKLIAVNPGSALLYHAGETIQLKLISGVVKQVSVPVP